MFDTNVLNQIPIISVAEKLGLKVTKKRSMCFNSHDKKTPSLTFNTNNNLWHCFGCGSGGNNINLVEKCLKYNFMDACLWLENEFDVNSTYFRVSNLNKPINLHIVNKPFHIKEQEDNKPDIEVYEWLISSCSLSENAREYLISKRGFSKKTLDFFNIKSIEKPFKKFEEAKYLWGIDRLIKCGLAKKTELQQVKFIWWNEIILFPFYNLMNRIIYIQGRQIGDLEPKYINLKGVETYIYNLNVINNMSKNKPIYICEGIPDALTAYERGLNAVGIMGANNFKDEWTNYFTPYQINVVPDNDAAGERFSEAIESYFKSVGKPIQIVRVPDKKDLTEYTKCNRKNVKT